jgi:hypothetical protein
MQKKLYQFMLALTMIAVVMAGTTPVHADDGTTEPAGAEEQPVEESAPEESAPAETVEEILEQVPEGIELIVVSEEGVEPLASEEAAEIILEGDPMWCPDGVTPGDITCTGSFGDFASLIAALSADAASVTPVYTGNGVIWVEDSYAGNDDDQIEFNGSVLTTLQNLTIRGGWSGGNDTNITGTSSADVSMVFVNWTGNITISDLAITAGDDAGFGLFVDNVGTISLDNVSVNGTTENTFGFGDGAVLNATGDVDISNSQFDGNEGNGLQVESGGTIDLDTVSASTNTLTGAFLDSCLYGSVTAGLCAGSGAVTITSATSNLFNDNDFNGLVVDAGGGIAMDHVQANANALNGAFLTSADDDGTGNVSVDQSEFNGNSNGSGLDVLTDGNIGVTNTNAFSNNTGAILDTTSGTSAINVSDSNFGVDITTGNDGTGLHAESGSTIDLNNVVASYNGANGAYLTAEGNITVNNSTFNENVHFNFPQDPGLYAKSHGGDITLSNVIASGNDFGAGSVLSTGNTGAINITSGQFDGNGTFGLQAQGQDGDITINGITASFNMAKGTYLSTYGLGNIIINNSGFVENGSVGIYANTSEGNINLDNDTVTGDNGIDDGAPGADDLTDYGAVLKGNNIFVSNSSFNLNTEVGLRVVAGGQVDLVNVTADQNGGNGVEVYSTNSGSSVCPDEAVVNIVVNADGGTFTANIGYGLMVKPGPGGNLVFINPSTFGGNGLGDYLLDLSAPSESGDCGHKDETPSDSKGPKIVQVPATGGTPVVQECDLFSSTILELPNGTWINVGCPFEGFSNLEEILQENLPGELGAGTNFSAGITVSLTDDGGNTTLNEDGTITINFKIPEDSRGRGYSILFWDPTLNGGAGGWVEIPLYEFGTSFPLTPGDPADERLIVSGVQQIGDIMTITVNFPGVFVLVAR